MTEDALEDELHNLSNHPPLPYHVWWHNKGYYQVVITDCRRDTDKVLWISYFISKNCDFSLKKFDGAFLRQDEKTPPEDVVFESWYNDTSIKINSAARFLDTFQKEKPAKVKNFKVVEAEDVVQVVEVVTQPTK